MPPAGWSDCSSGDYSDRRHPDGDGASAVGSPTITLADILVNVIGGRMSTREQDVLRRAGEASVLVLISLADGPKHGYALIQDIRELAGVELGPGTLYGALDRLERLRPIEMPPPRERGPPDPDTPPGGGGAPG